MPLELELMTSVFATNQDADVRRVAGYFFIANGRSCASSFAVRGLAFDWSQEYAYYCKVQFSGSFKASTGDDFLDTYQTQVSGLAQELLPDLMRCLPDWSEVESASGAGSVPNVENSPTQAS